jgi:peptide/nickel transport system substrate-binding protein
VSLPRHPSPAQPSASFVSRRYVLRGLALAAGGSLLLACQPTTAPSPTPAPAAKPTEAAKPAAAPTAAGAAAPTVAPAAVAKPAPTQELALGQGTVPRNMDPKLTTALSDYLHLRLVYDTLVSADSGKPEPWAAESWEARSDTHWRFKLRPNLKFSNGEPFDANAVKFTLERVLSDEKAPWRARIQMIERVEVVDERTIDLLLNQPAGDLPTRLAIVWIMPPKYSQEKGDQGVATAPIGSGPFTVAEYQPAQSVSYKANPQYWGGPPKLQTLRFRALPEPSTRVSSLLAGEIDVAHLILPEQMDQIKSRGYQVVSVPTGQSANLFMQQSRDTPLKHAKVRQAIDYAIDKDGLFQLTGGLGRPLNGQIVGPNSVGYNPNIKARPFDPARAKQLLAEAGMANGFEIALDTPIGRYFRDKEMSETIAAYLQAVGIKVQLNALAGGPWLDRLYTGTWGPLNYWSIQDAPAYDLAFTMDIFQRSNNRKILDDDQFEALFKRSFEITDQQARNKHLQDCAQYIHDQAFMVNFHQDPGLYGVSPKVKDIEFLPSTYIQLLKAHKSE